MTNTITEPAIHANRRPIFQPSERKIMQNGLNSVTRACEAQEKLISVIKKELARIRIALRRVDRPKCSA